MRSSTDRWRRWTPPEAATAAKETALRRGSFASWQESERLVRDPVPRGLRTRRHPIDHRIPLGGVWMDMVAFNDGPIGCFA